MHSNMTAPLDEEWLKAVGFKWHQLDRQPQKHWLLWLGAAANDGHSFTSYEDIGIEVAAGWWFNRNGERINDRGQWFCWLRSDGAGRYHRFIHLRHIHTRADVANLVEAITGQPWNPANHVYGSCQKPEQAARDRADKDRLDRRLLRDGHPWSPVEADDTMGGALPEHLAAHETVKPEDSPQQQVPPRRRCVDCDDGPCYMNCGPAIGNKP